MSTFSQWTLNLVIWSLTAAGLFFGLRAAWRRRSARLSRRDRSAEP